MSDAPPDGMGPCEFCDAILPFVYADHFETGELVICFPGYLAHDVGCPFNEPFPEERPF